MFTINSSNLVPILQTAIGPVILISGIGLLLLTMTNRLGRVIDRARVLVADEHGNRQQIEAQISVLKVRARLLRMAILLASLSVLCTALLIILLFLSVLMKIEMGLVICGLFITVMLALIGSSISFILEVNQTLEALKLELEQYENAGNK